MYGHHKHISSTCGKIFLNGKSCGTGLANPVPQPCPMLLRGGNERFMSSKVIQKSSPNPVPLSGFKCAIQKNLAICLFLRSFRWICVEFSKIFDFQDTISGISGWLAQEAFSRMKEHPVVRIR